MSLWPNQYIQHSISRWVNMSWDNFYVWVFPPPNIHVLLYSLDICMSTNRKAWSQNSLKTFQEKTIKMRYVTSTSSIQVIWYFILSSIFHKSSFVWECFHVHSTSIWFSLNTLSKIHLALVVPLLILKKKGRNKMSQCHLWQNLCNISKISWK